MFVSNRGRASIGVFALSLVCATSVACLTSACSTTRSRTGPEGTPVTRKEPTRTERARMLIEIANSALVEGDSIGALENLMRAEKEDAKLPELYHSMALAYYMKHDTSSALEKARKAVELKQDYSDANNNLGKLLMDSGKTDQSIAPLMAAAKDPVYRDVYKPLTNLGILHYRQGSYDRAETFLSNAIQEAPAVACVAYYYRGHLRLRESRFSDA